MIICQVPTGSALIALWAARFTHPQPLAGFPSPLSPPPPSPHPIHLTQITLTGTHLCPGRKDMSTDDDGAAPQPPPQQQPCATDDEQQMAQWWVLNKG